MDRSAGGPSAQSQPWKKDVRKQFRRPSFGRCSHSPRVRLIEAGLTRRAGTALTHGFQYAGYDDRDDARGHLAPPRKSRDCGL
jgi:hypothetical protein